MLLPGRGCAPFLLFLLPKATFNTRPHLQAIFEHVKCCFSIRNLADDLIRALPHFCDPLPFEAMQFLQCQPEGCEEQLHFHLIRPDDLVLDLLFHSSLLSYQSTLLSVHCGSFPLPFRKSSQYCSLRLHDSSFPHCFSSR